MPRVKGITEKDLIILRKLVENGRVTYTQIARELGKSPAGVMKRVRKLEELGIIKGYTTHVDHAKLGLPLMFTIVAHFKKPPTVNIDEDPYKSHVLSVTVVSNLMVMTVVVANYAQLFDLLDKVYALGPDDLVIQPTKQYATNMPVPSSI